MLSDCHPPGNTRSARPSHCKCYFQISANAEVKSVPVSSLPPALQQKIQRLDSHNDSAAAPSVICVSQVTKHVFPVSYQPSALNGAAPATLPAAEHPLYGQSRSSPVRPNPWPVEESADAAACFVPIKSSKKTASTILQLLQAGDLDNEENVMPMPGDFVCCNSRVIGIKANVLCMYKKKMYLLPEHPSRGSHVEADVEELVTRYPGDTTFSPDPMTDISSNAEDEFIFQESWSEADALSPNSDTSAQQDDLSDMTADRSGNGSNLWSIGDKSSVIVIQKNEDRCHLLEAIPSIKENTALIPKHFTHSEIIKQELITGYLKDAIFSPETVTDTNSNIEDDCSVNDLWSETNALSPNSDTSAQQDDLSDMTADSSGSNHWPVRDKSPVIVIQTDETTCHLAEADTSTNENTALKPTHFAHSKKNEQELLTRYPKDAISSPETVTDTNSNIEDDYPFGDLWSETDALSPNSDTSAQQDDLSDMTADSSGNGSSHWPVRDKSPVIVIQKDETTCHIAEADTSTNENTALKPTHFAHSDKNEQIPVRKKQIKRKTSSLDDVGNVKKKSDLNDSVTKQESKSVHTPSSFSIITPTTSPVSPHVGSPSSPSGPPISFHSRGADQLSISNRLCGVSPIAPTPGGTNTAVATSSSSSYSLAISTSTSRTADSAESSQCHIIPASEPPPSGSISRPELASFPDVDEITRDETARRLVDRVRELNKIVEDMRMKNKKN